MGLLGLIVMGAIVGMIADALDKRHDNSLLANTVFGMVGALAGGFLRGVFTGTDQMVFDFWSFVWALVGTVLVLFTFNALRRR